MLFCLFHTTAPIDPTPEIRRIPRKKLLLRAGMITGCVVLILAVLLSVICGSVHDDRSVFLFSYNNMLLQTDGEKNTDPALLSSQLVQDNKFQLTVPVTDARFAQTVQEAGGYRFIADRFCENEFWLHRQKGNTVQTVAKNVSAYTVSADGKLVTYLTADGSLIQTDLQTRTTLDKTVAECVVLDDGQTLLYRKQNQLVFAKTADAQPQQVAALIEQIILPQGAQKPPVFLLSNKASNRTLYCWDGKKLTTVAQNVTQVVRCYCDGKAYYICQNEASCLLDYVKDDLQQSDKNEISLPRRPKVSDYKDFAEFQAANAECDRIAAAFYARARRMQLRQTLAQLRVSAARSLHYFDGKQSTRLAESVTDIMQAATETAAIAYLSCAVQQPEQLILSKMWESYDQMSESAQEQYLSRLVRQTEDSYTQQSSLHTAVGKNTAVRSKNEIHAVYLSPAGKTVYYRYENQLWKSSADAKQNDFVRTATNAERVYGFLLGDERLFYSDVPLNKSSTLGNSDSHDRQVGNLFCDGTQVDDEVLLSSITPSPATGQIVYIKRLQNVEGYDMLYLWDGTQAKEVTAAVEHFRLLPNGELLYLRAWDSREKGELYLFDGKKSRFLHSDVSGILVPSAPPAVIKLSADTPFCTQVKLPVEITVTQPQSIIETNTR